MRQTKASVEPMTWGGAQPQGAGVREGRDGTAGVVTGRGSCPGSVGQGTQVISEDTHGLLYIQGTTWFCFVK